MRYKFVYAKGAATQFGLKGKGSKTQVVSVGAGHIFPLVRDHSGHEGLDTKALCGTSYSEVGKGGAMELAERVPHLPMCRICLDKWKEDPDGPYAKWILSSVRPG